MVDILFVFVIAGLFLFKMNGFYNVRELSLKSENKKYKYTLLIVQQNGIENTLNFYSDFGEYTVDNLMNYIWDKDSRTYVLKQENAKRNLCTIDTLYYCESFVEKVGDEE